MKRAVWIAGLSIFSGIAQAHPVSYKGSTGVMIWNQSFLNDTLVTYSFARQVAVAGRFLRMTRPAGDMYQYLPQLNFLVKRWHGDRSQANLYTYGGFGVSRFLEDTSWGALAGVEADAETRRYYVSGKFQTSFFKSDDRMYQSQLRVGIAPYLSDFNEIASWLLLSVQYEPQLIKEWVVTPMIRMFYKSVLWEMGSSFKGDWMLNFMIHF